MRRQLVIFILGLVAGVAVCLGSQWFNRWYSTTQVTMKPNTATNLALLYGVAIEADRKHPDLALQYWSRERRQYVTAAELRRLAEVALASPGCSIERYVGLRYGQSNGAGASIVLLRVIEPGLVGNQYWTIEDALLFPAAEFDGYGLQEQLSRPPAQKPQ